MNATIPHSRHTSLAFVARLICVGFLIASAALRVSAQNRVRVESTKGSLLQIQPGSMVTVPIKITNDGSETSTIHLSARLPSGWRQLTRSQPAILDPASSSIRLITISPPTKIAADRYEIVISAIDSAHIDQEELIPVMIDVERLVSFELLQLNAPRFSIGGENITYQYEVINTGNDMLDVSIDARSTQNFIVGVGPRLLQIPLGASAYFDVVTTIPLDLPRKVKHGLIVTVTPTDGAEARSMTTISDVLPKVSSTDPDRYEFPLFGSIRLVGDDDRRGVQAELRGYGSVREDKSDRLEFSFRTPETQTISILGERDEYQARYSWGRNRIYAGDWNYSLSTLTEVGRYAFGVGGETSVQDVTVGGFLNSTRIGSPARKQVAGYAKYDVTSDIQGGFNIIHRDEKTSSTVVSVSALTSPFGTSKLDVEGAVSAGPGSGDAAVSARLQGPLSFGLYDLRVISAGKEFGSYYRDVQVTSASISAYASQNIRFDLLARDERRNTSLDTLLRFSPRTQFAQIGGGLSDFLNVYYRVSSYSDPLSASGRDTREDIVQIRASQRISFIYAAANIDIGTQTHRSSSFSGPTRRFALNVNAQPFPRQSYTASIEHASTPDPTSGQTTERLSTSFAANYRITDLTTARFLAFSSSTVSTSDQSYTILDASVDHVFASQHRITGRVRSTSLSGAKTEVAAALEYGIPLAIPMGTISTSGVLSGRILDPEGDGLAGVYVSVGTRAAVSDPTGLFAIRNMMPGTYELHIDRGSLGLKQIVDISLPLEVHVVGGEETSVVLRTVTPGVLQGVAHLFENVPTGIRDSVIRTEVPIDGSILLAVDLQQGKERLRRVTNSRGIFVFTDLRPGTWKVTVTPIRLPDEAALVDREATVEIAEGQSTLLNVEIAPRQRRIRILQEGGVLRPKQ